MGLYQWADYAIYLGILAVILLVLYRLFHRIRFEKKLIIAVLPFIFVGTFIRVLADIGVYEWNQWWSVTPGVYVVTLLLALSSIGAGILYQRIFHRSYGEVAFIAGSAISLYLFSLISPYLINPAQALYTIVLAVSITLSVYALSIPLRIRIFQSAGNIAILFAHMLDASSTFIAYDYFGFYEEHILPGYIISLAGDTALVMVPAKLLLVGLTLHYLEKWRLEDARGKKNETAYLMTKFLLLIIGIGPGLRNTMLPALSL